MLFNYHGKALQSSLYTLYKVHTGHHGQQNLVSIQLNIFGHTVTQPSIHTTGIPVWSSILKIVYLTLDVSYIKVFLENCMVTTFFEKEIMN